MSARRPAAPRPCLIPASTLRFFTGDKEMETQAQMDTLDAMAQRSDADPLVPVSLHGAVLLCAARAHPARRLPGPAARLRNRPPLP